MPIGYATPGGLPHVPPRPWWTPSSWRSWAGSWAACYKTFSLANVTFWYLILCYIIRTKLGPSFQLKKRLNVLYASVLLWSKTDYLKLENSAQTTPRLSPVRYRVPRFGSCVLQIEPNTNLQKDIWTINRIHIFASLVWRQSETI